MTTAHAQGFTATADSVSKAINEVLQPAVLKQFGGWGQKIVKAEVIAEGYCPESSPNVTYLAPKINTYDTYSKSEKVIALAKKQVVRVYMEYKNPSPLLSHQAKEPIVRQSVDIVIVNP